MDPLKSEKMTKSTGMRNRLLAVIAPLSLLLITFIWFAGPVFTDATLSQISPGMNQREVVERLGQPTRRYVKPTCWDYERPGNPGWVRIDFDEDGTVSAVDNESAFGW